MFVGVLMELGVAINIESIGYCEYPPDLTGITTRLVLVVVESSLV